MRSLFTSWASTTTIPNLTLITHNPPLHFPGSFLPIKPSLPLPRITISQFSSNPRSNEDEQHPESQVEELIVPDHWLHPSKALEESEWLRVTLHKWLDDEYCPEPTNVEISEVAARSFYESLLDKQTDLGEILLKMARKLESISYQESFHGAFSSANAAVNLIAERIEQS
ncbi:Auxin response factor [Melia azedarach]|uniref:Auxin response factor n=1 Tax=Melia azedarach TaxID=155640 RepID=A0ACC1YX21_MELAZ|nr:Auxin response factor [Melia azedarach]